MSVTLDDMTFQYVLQVMMDFRPVTAEFTLTDIGGELQIEIITYDGKIIQLSMQGQQSDAS